MNVWVLLSIFVVFGGLFSMLIVFLHHKKEMKKLEIEAIKARKQES